MFCEKCGKEIQTDSMLCDECLQNENSEAISEDANNTDENLREPIDEAEAVCEEGAGETSDIGADGIAVESTTLDEQKLPKRIKEKRKRRIGAHIGSSLIAVLLAVMLIATTCLLIIREAVSPDTIKEMINNIDLKEIKIDNEESKQLLESHGLICNSDNLFEIIYDNIDQSELPTQISKEEFLAIVDNEQFREYFGQIFGVSIEALTSGDSSDVVTPDDIVDYLASNREQFSLLLGYELTDERLDNLRKTLVNDYGKVFEAIGDKKLDVIFDDSIATAVNIVFSDWLFWILVLIDIVLGSLIFLIMRSVSSGVKYCGITVAVVGTIYLCASIAVLNGVLSDLVGGPLMYVINQLVSVVLWEAIVIAFIMIVLGIAAPLGIKLIGRYKKRHVI